MLKIERIISDMYTLNLDRGASHYRSPRRLYIPRSLLMLDLLDILYLSLVLVGRW